MDHHNLSPELNAAIRSLDDMVGLFVDNLPKKHVVEARTKNHVYTLSRESCVLGGTYSGWRFNGSTFGGSAIRVGWVGQGMYLEFQRGHEIVTTSSVQEINVVKE